MFNRIGITEKEIPLQPESGYESSFREGAVKLEGMRSQNKRWLAFVAQHIYGPEDVLVIEFP